MAAQKNGKTQHGFILKSSLPKAIKQVNQGLWNIKVVGLFLGGEKKIEIMNLKT